MKLITRRTLIREVVKRWMRQYPDDKDGKGAKLRMLDLDTCDRSSVDAIIGNDSWTRLPTCDECGTEAVPVAIEVGQEPDYESHTATLCGECLERAAKYARTSHEEDTCK